MSLRIQLECYHEFRCDCKQIRETQVSRDEVAYNLIRCNPALAKYLNKSTVLAQTLVDRKSIQINYEQMPYKSIVQQKNLNILLSHQYPLPPTKQQQRQHQKQKSSSPQLKINNFISTEVQTSPFPQNPPIKPKQSPQSPRQKQIKSYFKQMKHSSRYLSDTGFRKYFNRQVFQNYGRQNTHGTNDGIIYGNYLKTHNINPHTGYNHPQDQETFYHALTSASPQKLLPLNVNQRGEQNKSRNMSQSRLKEKNESLQKPLKKHQNDTEQIIGDNVRYHEKLNQLSKSQMMIMTNKQQKSTSPLHHYSNQIQTQYLNIKQTIQPFKPGQNRKSPKDKLSPSVNLISAQRQQINKLSQIKPIGMNKCPVDMIKQRHKEYILSKDCNVRM